jgi:hypothetical protein
VERVKLSEEERKKRKAESQKRWREANREKTRESYKRWCEANREKARESRKLWREANREAIAAKEKDYREANSEKIRKRRKAYYAANKEAELTKVKIYHAANRELRRALEAARRARKLNATPTWADLNAIKDIYMTCPEGYHVDHIIPLKNDRVCGLHVETNLQHLPAAENISKSNRLDESYL